MEKYHIGDRLQIGDDICTVRYIGRINVWQNELAFGVEWDDPKRGKHSGTLNGHKYFETVKQNTGSFIKLSKVERAVRRGFIEAVRDIYGTPTDVDYSLRINSKNIEYVGFDVLNSRNKEINSLETISLERKSIFCLTTQKDDIPTMSNHFKNLKNLNISNNLISEFGNVLQLLEIMPNLSTLNISGNRFIPYETKPYEMKTFDNVRHLSLSYCEISIVCLKCILEYFPSLESLDLGGNDLSELISVTLPLPKYLKHLSLSNACLEELPVGLNSWKLDYLNLSHNAIKSVVSGLDEEDSREFSLTQLDLSHNEINKWESIDEINETFLKLKSLRINNNPVLSRNISEVNQLETDKQMFLNVLARFNNLDILDGSHLTEEIKEEAELYLLSVILSNTVRLTKDKSRWSYFRDKYGISEMSDRNLPQEYMENSLLVDLEVLKLHAHYNYKNMHFRIDLLPNSTVRYMKSIISRHIDVPILQIKVLYEPTNEAETMAEITRNFSLISDLGLTSGSNIYVMHK
ncbi:similar to Saccharomyces cerevisiae YER007W PAC2 Microtubule effector required for tubulin heterodimer formation [Maudiozyma saulgeensis]|uniref:Similar to Saccharomyces cerevisiae YER007W PAC2 Microtubule effector required for tubulin heterodimer formation n=1 Tax=Maudiozyma saulgeensis TaxID=1789683 RepID=A0A1X7R3A2_9SACH|nr:similar to Saccharomyces cerevisiae YER007W PAC2 Microtubule effector required for tubulin heterodimer formation [Kazachstania saulgeensis]